jgi:hypothetical protein
VEKFDLACTPHAEQQRWRNGDEWDEAATHIAVGTLSGGRWYVRMFGGGIGWVGERIGRAYAGPHAEHYARTAARSWRRIVGGAWIEAGGDPRPVPVESRPRAPITEWP